MGGLDTQAGELIQGLFTESQDPVFIVDGDHRKLLDANRAAQKWTGLNHQDLLAARFDQLLQFQENGYHPGTDGQETREGATYRSAVLHSRKAGPMPVQASVVPLPGSKTKRANVIVVRDARPIKALECGNKTLMERIAELEFENAQLKDTHPGHSYFTPAGTDDIVNSADLVQGVARHFNDLATVVVASSTLVRGSINSTSPNQTFLRAIEEATLRASDMMGMLLGAVSRAPFHRREVSLASLVDEALQRVSLPAGVTLKSNVSTTAGAFAADPELLGRALQHLIQNSADAMPKGGQITLDAAITHIEEKDLADRSEQARPGSFVKIRISDSGPGMDRDVLQKASTPFFTTKGDPKKAGLGLPFVKGVCLLHGGWFELTSPPGKGTHASLFLPKPKQ